ncbi:hypothetical protein [Hasllibacter sp. MH4015]|uniref:hypothetical protein n=1 Tax=Hasllibacter sp. MH4015 TaxID=2854029 RepID=UPI001CD770EA|nr:hypothetical protein [Hasllibacter sp. MH4015]
MRASGAILALVLAAAPAHADPIDAVMETLWQTHGGELAGRSYSPMTTSRPGLWHCDGCPSSERVHIDTYDYAYNYDTTDRAQVYRMISGACGMTGCETHMITLADLPALRQSGMARRGGGHDARISLILDDRLIIWEVEGHASATMVDTVMNELIAETLPLFLAAR